MGSKWCLQVRLNRFMWKHGHRNAHGALKTENLGQMFSPAANGPVSHMGTSGFDCQLQLLTPNSCQSTPLGQWGWPRVSGFLLCTSDSWTEVPAPDGGGPKPNRNNKIGSLPGQVTRQPSGCGLWDHFSWLKTSVQFQFFFVTLPFTGRSYWECNV